MGQIAYLISKAINKLHRFYRSLDLTYPHKCVPSWLVQAGGDDAGQDRGGGAAGGRGAGGSQPRPRAQGRGAGEGY